MIKALVAIIRPFRPREIFYNLSSSVYMKVFHIGYPLLLHNPWTTLSLHCEFYLYLSSNRKNLCPDFPNRCQDLTMTCRGAHGPEGTRFSVDIDMSIAKSAPLAMNQTQFTLLALGLGASPYNMDLQSSTTYFVKDHKKSVLLRKSVIDGRLYVKIECNRDYDFSLRRAFAYEGLLICRGEFSCVCHPLCRGRAVPLESVKINQDEIPSDILLTSSANEMYSEPISGGNMKDCPDQLVAALIWSFYVLEHFRYEQDLPVSEQIQEVQQRSLLFLKKRDKERSLKLQVRALFLSQSFFSPYRGKFDCQYAREKLPEYTSHQLINQTSGCLEEAIAHSAYITESENLQNQLSELKATCGQMFKQRASQSLEKHQPLTHLLENIEFIEKSSLKPRSPVKRGSMIRLLQLVPFEEVEKLAKLLHSHKGTEKIPDVYSKDELNEKRMLGHILLGIADWGGCQKRAWPLNEDIASHLRQVKEQLMSPLDEIDAERVVEKIDAAMSIAEEGAYSAPAFSLKDIIHENGQVYLI